MRAYVQGYVPQKEVACRHRVTVQLVKDLVFEHKKNPEKNVSAKQKLKDTEATREKI